MKILFDKPAISSRLQWVMLVLGLAIWLGVQGYLVLMPVFSRAEPPEPDDVLPYIARTARMEKCLWGDCQALKDLTEQFSRPSPDREADTYREWAGTIFGSNQVGLSVVLLTLKHFGLDFMTGYRVICVLAVLIFGTGFAYLLTALWDKPTAGLALLMLAFKVFPDTGLNFVVPSNICMGLATLVWARVISKQGKALWTLGIGSVVLISFHPIGAAYSLMAAALAVAYSDVSFSRRTWTIAALVGFVLAVALIMPTEIYNLSQYFTGIYPSEILTHGALSVVAVLVEVVRLDAGLYGLLAIFLPCVTLGMICASPQQRRIVTIFLKIYSIFLIFGLFYPPRQPGDTFLRMWIPAVVVIFGSISMAWWSTSVRAWQFLKKFRAGASDSSSFSLHRAWPLVAAAAIAGYAIQMGIAGGEQVAVISQHYKNRQPLKVCSHQTEALLLKANAGDKVLYESMMLMQCYFIRGSLGLGAVYYHPILLGTTTETEWLRQQDLRFAVAYNPLVIHPTFEGLHERRWGVSSPDFRFSPLIGGKRHGPILHEDGIAVHGFKWLDVEWGQDSPPRLMKVIIDNPGDECVMRVSPFDGSGQPSEHRTISLKIPKRVGQQVSWEFEGTPDLKETIGHKDTRPETLTIDLASIQAASKLRLSFPIWNSRARILSLTFDDSRLNWPWEHKARLLITGKSWDIGTMRFSFDPAKMLPESLQHYSARVIDDCGSSVLLEIQPSQ